MPRPNALVGGAWQRPHVGCMQCSPDMSGATLDSCGMGGATVSAWAVTSRVTLLSQWVWKADNQTNRAIVFFFFFFLRFLKNLFTF